MLAFFLGGADLEMVEIEKLLRDRQPSDPPYSLCAKRLPWGAGISAYRAEAEAALARGDMLVLVELRNDLNLPTDRIVEVDHHGERAGADKPTSIEQVYTLLGRPRPRASAARRRLELVIANDRGYIPGLLAARATPAEAAAIRAKDRRAQGITTAEEEAAAEAAARRQTLNDGDLTIVELPHDRFAAVSDRLHQGLGGPGYRSLLILGYSEAQYDGSGNVVARLSAAVPGSWCGGALPQRGFWGCRYASLGAADGAAARPRLLQMIAQGGDPRPRP